MAERIESMPTRAARRPQGVRPAAAGRLPRAMAQAPRSRPLRVPELVVGVLLVAGCALLAVVFSSRSNATTTVVVASRTVARGSAIVADDLKGAEMAGATTAMVRGSNAVDLIGQIALVDIAANSPLTQSVVTSATPLLPGEALTSMALAPGQVPPDLAPNDHVRVVVTSIGVAGETQAALLDEQAVVWSVSLAPDGTSTIVTVRGPISLSSAVASAAKVQLARVGDR
ncbi:MAG: SAF domain-containing protein [Actinomycetota bacterium]